jgi:hypothetical protein
MEDMLSLVMTDREITQYVNDDVITRNTQKAIFRTHGNPGIILSHKDKSQWMTTTAAKDLLEVVSVAKSTPAILTKGI